MQKMGGTLDAKAKPLGFSDDKIKEMRGEVIELWDQLTGTSTTDLKTF